VQSAPVGGISIGGTARGVTDYEAFGTAASITLTAPPEHADGLMILRFIRWTVDETPRADGQATIEINAFPAQEYAAVAVYEHVPASALMTLEGPGERGEVLPPGPGSFIVNIYGQGFQELAGVQTMLQFIDVGGTDAEFLVHESGGAFFEGMDIAHNAELYPSIYSFAVTEPANPLCRRMFGFINWEGPNPIVTEKTLLLTVRYDYPPEASGSFTIVPHPAQTLFAGPEGRIPFEVAAGSVTIPRSSRLSVTSAPIAGVAVSGSKPGTTNYAAFCQQGETIGLAVPSRTTIAGTEYVFIRWVLDGVNQPPCRTELEFIVGGDHSACAAWTIPGDLNGDCRINVLDLIAIRNRLDADPSIGNNLLADVNDDGRINVLDLIQARNRLGALCGPALSD